MFKVTMELATFIHEEEQTNKIYINIARRKEL